MRLGWGFSNDVHAWLNALLTTVANDYQAVVIVVVCISVLVAMVFAPPHATAEPRSQHAEAAAIVFQVRFNLIGQLL